jgi:hypothetical protein
MLDFLTRLSLECVMLQHDTSSALSIEGRILNGLATIRACRVVELEGELNDGVLTIDSREAAWILTILEHETGTEVDAKRIEIEVLTDFARLRDYMRANFPDLR